MISAFQQLKNLRDEIFLLLLLSSLSVHLLGPAPASFLFSSISSSRWLQPKNLLGVLLACQKLTGSCWGLSLLSPSVQELGLEQLSAPPPSTLHPPPSRSGGGSFWRILLEGVTSLSLPPRAATDHNSDNTTALLKEWLGVMQRFYHHVEWRPLEQPT